MSRSSSCIRKPFCVCSNRFTSHQIPQPGVETSLPPSTTLTTSLPLSTLPPSTFETHGHSQIPLKYIVAEDSHAIRSCSDVAIWRRSHPCLARRSAVPHRPNRLRTDNHAADQHN